MEQIVFLDRQSLKAEVRKPGFAHHWEEHAQTLEQSVVDRLSEATVAITNKVPIRRAALEQLPNLKMIAVAATGYDVIDVDACRERGVAVANIRNYAVHTVPEHSFALIFALRRNLIAYREDVVSGRWPAQDQFCFFDHPIHDLHGSTIGIFGEGVLGQGTGYACAICSPSTAESAGCRVHRPRSGFRRVGHYFPALPFDTIVTQFRRS